MILWKNVWYNLITRNLSRIKYYWKGQHKDSYYPLSNWSSWYYPLPLPWTKEQEDKLHAELKKAMAKHDFIPPVFGLCYPRQQSNTPRQGQEDNTNDEKSEHS